MIVIDSRDPRVSATFGDQKKKRATLRIIRKIVFRMAKLENRTQISYYVGDKN